MKSSHWLFTMIMLSFCISSATSNKWHVVTTGVKDLLRNVYKAAGAITEAAAGLYGTWQGVLALDVALTSETERVLEQIPFESLRDNARYLSARLQNMSDAFAEDAKDVANYLIIMIVLSVIGFFFFFVFVFFSQKI